MSLVNNSANNFKDFLDAIKPYLNYQFYDLSGQGVEANNFSTDEKVIGTWIDGKPLYQKTVSCGALPNNTSKSVNIQTSNIDTVAYMYGYAKNTSSGDYQTIPLQGGSNGVQLYFSSGAICFWSSFDASAFNESYVTIKYTKTTDTAVASGEKIVGQWIDGKPVYEKTLTGLKFSSAIQTDGGATAYKTYQLTDLGFIDVDSIVSLYSTEPMAWFKIENNVLCHYSRVITSTTSALSIGSNRITDNGRDCAPVTLRYTKTTD